MHSFADGPGLNAAPGSPFRLFPVFRFDGAEEVELEGEVGVSCSDEFVVDGFFRSTEVASEAALGAFDEIAHVQHAKFLDGALVRPVFYGVLAEPAGSWAVAAFATDAVADVEGLSALLRRNSKGVAGQTARGLVWRMLEF